ncbi:hypothetical protein PISMIDRAFT_680404 [Pisolithus microcarpus 441]|uniref:Uncharacterized protein n=1 Tax=Pisolithus microcarpus 441 TaxID=765257 RepID=A0A0C9ZRK5_9AGAM|nr:hypothetical protein PISMIDRAFT_680404 [Pisolithus microcarpus 441]
MSYPTSRTPLPPGHAINVRRRGLSTHHASFPPAVHTSTAGPRTGPVDVLDGIVPWALTRPKSPLK